MRLIVLSLLSVVLMGSSVAWAAEPIVTLTADERAGVARENEPITGGVPLPQGLLKDAKGLALLDGDGQPLPASFEVINRWPKDQSVRWLLLDTAASAPAGGAATFQLVRGADADPTGASGGGLKVVKGKSQIDVDTGVLKFTVKTRGGFDVIHEAYLGQTQVVAPSSRGLYMQMDGGLYSSVYDKTAKMVVERESDQAVVIRVTGQMGTRGGEDGFDYTVWIYAYAGSPRLRIVPVVRRMYGKRDDTSKVRDLGLELAVPDGLAQRFAIGGEASIETGDLVAGEKAGIAYSASDRYDMFGAASGSGKGKSTKPLTVGWADLSGESAGLAMGVRYFWQTHPKAMSVTRGKNGGGTITAHLIASEKKPLEIHSGMARSQEILLFPNADLTPEAVQDVFVGHQLPLRPLASVEWNCGSGAFGSIAPAGARLTAGAKDVAQWDAVMAKQYKKVMRQRDRWKKKGVTTDAYGYLGFGDTLHWVWEEEPKDSPWALAWDSNYYDKPLMMLLFWARTGQPELLDFFDVSSWHLMDVDVIHYHKGFDDGAGSRRCPATNHVGFDPPNHRQAVGNFSFDHHKSESLFYRYYMFGDPWALQVALGLADWADEAGSQDSGRKFAHQMNTLVAAWEYSGDRKWLKRARDHFEDMIDEHEDGWPEGNFQNGFMMEAIAKYYLASGDKTALRALLGYCNHHLKDKYRFPNMAYGYAVAWQATGKEQYLAAALENMNHGKPSHVGKDTPMHYRATAWTTGILADPKKK